jgi:hypothetical protein
MCESGERKKSVFMSSARLMIVAILVRDGNVFSCFFSKRSARAFWDVGKSHFSIVKETIGDDNRRTVVQGRLLLRHRRAFTSTTTTTTITADGCKRMESDYQHAARQDQQDDEILRKAVSISRHDRREISESPIIRVKWKDDDGSHRTQNWNNRCLVLNCTVRILLIKDRTVRILIVPFAYSQIAPLA